VSEDIEFLSIQDIILLHKIAVSKFGGSRGIRDKGLLESAAAQPQATFGGQYLHASLFDKAAAYAFHIAQNQPFIDGNKRTGLLAALVFLTINGIELNQPSEHLEKAMNSIAERTMDKTELARLLERLVKVDESDF